MTFPKQRKEKYKQVIGHRSPNGLKWNAKANKNCEYQEYQNPTAMGFFSSDEIVANTSSDNTIIEAALIVIVLLVIFYTCGKLYAKFMKNNISEVARREVQLNAMRQV